MASGALPELYDPKEISGRKFWDGGVLVNARLENIESRQTNQSMISQTTRYPTDLNR